MSNRTPQIGDHYFDGCHGVFVDPAPMRAILAEHAPEALATMPPLIVDWSDPKVAERCEPLDLFPEDVVFNRDKNRWEPA